MQRENITRKANAGSASWSDTYKKQIEWMLIGFLFLAFMAVSMAQTNLQDINYGVKSDFEPTIKDAIKFSDLPEIKDSVKRIESIKYNIGSRPLFPKYQVQQVEPVKLQNEPLPKLYHSLLKVGYAPIYNMPYGEFWFGSTRSRENNYGAHLKHFSSTNHLQDVGYSGFSDNAVNAYGKRFYKKHTLSGDLNYELNSLHYYGYDTSLKLNNPPESETRQRYQLIEPKVQLQSHYTDSNHVNHHIKLGYYNYSNLYSEFENNVKLNAYGSMFVNKEKLNIHLLTDYYNHRQTNDTLNDLIIGLNPSFEANGKKWHADLGLTATLDNFRSSSKFYFYPQLNVNYDIYENLVIPYVGVNGGLVKNSMRSLSRENAFVDTAIHFNNTDNKYNLFGGLRGNLSSNTSYDAKVSYGVYDNFNYFVTDTVGPGTMFNRFNVVYDNTTLLTVSGEVNYQMMEKLKLIAKGNYYLYKPKNLIRPFYKPEHDLTLSGIYNLQSKIILRLDIFVMGSQWGLAQVGATDVQQPKLLAGWVDLNLEAEYRYSKMLSFFARFNNIANQRYYRWEQYPSQRFNFMIGLSFVPF